MFKNKLFKSLYQVLEYILTEYNSKDDYFKFDNKFILSYKNLNSLIYLLKFNKENGKNKSLEELKKHLEEELEELDDVTDGIEEKETYEYFDIHHIFEEMSDSIFLASQILEMSEEEFFNIEGELLEEIFEAFNVIKEMPNFSFKGNNILEPLMKTIYYKSIEFYYPILLFKILNEREFRDESLAVIVEEIRIKNNFPFIDTWKIFNSVFSKRTKSEVLENEEEVFKEIRNIVRTFIEYK